MKTLSDISRGILKDSIQGLDIRYVSPTELSIAPGVGLNSNGKLLTLTSTFTKTISAWVAGTGNGGFVDSIANGAFTTNAGDTIHVFLIQDSTNGTHDVVFCNYLDPVLPTGFDQSLRVGGIVFQSSLNIAKFIKIDDFYHYDRVGSVADYYDYFASSLPSHPTWTDVSLFVPNQIMTEALIMIQANMTTGDSIQCIPGNSSIPFSNSTESLAYALFQNPNYTRKTVYTDDNRTIKIASVSNSISSLSLFTVGFRELS